MLSNVRLVARRLSGLGRWCSHTGQSRDVERGSEGGEKCIALGDTWVHLRKCMSCGQVGRRGKDTSERLGRHRWVVERTLAWLGKYRRRAARYERRDDIHEAFLDPGCSLICLNYLL